MLERRVRPGPAVARRARGAAAGAGRLRRPTRGAPACRAAGSCARCAARRRRCSPSTRARRSRPARRCAASPGGTFSVPPTSGGRSRRRARRARRQRVRVRRAGSLSIWRPGLLRRTGLGAGPRVLERASRSATAARPTRACASRSTTSWRRCSSAATRRWWRCRRCRSRPRAARCRPRRWTTPGGSTEAACHDQRVLLHAQALPNVGDLQANLDAMSDAVARYPIVCWKVFTNFPDLYDGSGNAWRLDDGDPSLARVGDAFLRHAVELGVPTVAAHKGLSTTLGLLVAVRVARRRRTGGTRASRRALPRVPLGLRGRPGRGPVRPGDRRPGREPPHREHAGRGHRTEPERVRRARHHVVVAPRATGRGRARARQAARPRRRGQRAVGHRRGLLRVAAGPDPGVPGLPDLRAVPGAVRLPRARPTTSSARSSASTPCNSTTSTRSRCRARSPAPTSSSCASRSRVSLERRGPRTQAELRDFVARERAEHGV